MLLPVVTAVAVYYAVSLGWHPTAYVCCVGRDAAAVISVIVAAHSPL
jgi:hypothetical protein